MSSEEDFAEISSMFQRMIEGEIVIDRVNRIVMMIRLAMAVEDFLNGDLSGKQGRSPASKSSVESMPRVVIGEDKEKGGSCSICLEEWSEGDVAAEMPCKHKFHSKCVEEWLGIHATCPLCRYEMPVEEEEEGKKVGVWIGFSVNGGQRRSEEGDGGRSRQSNDDSNTRHETEA